MKKNVLLLLLLAMLTPVLLAQVRPEQLVRAAQQPNNWLTYSGTYFSQRYSTLNQITPANVKNLQMRWMLQVKSLEKFEATPLVIDGRMYFTQAPNDVLAVDATSGRIFWQYSYEPSPKTRPCCGTVNRGLAILGDTLFMGTLDGALIALDAYSGKPVWVSNVNGADPSIGYSITLAPLVVKDKVIVGTAGGEYGIRGFIAAFDAKTGKEAWRFHTIPGPGEPGHETWAGDSWKYGGASVWVTGSFDPDLNLTYWGIGNPGPDYNGDNRAGDNLYSDSVVALDADTGTLKWHFQFTPHDVFDYDSVQIPVLADMVWQGRSRKVMLWANRNGFFYVLDRTNGQFLLGRAFEKVTWATGLDAKGRPILAPGAAPTAEGKLIYPGVQGATNWYSPSFSPRTGLFYIPTWVGYYSTFTKYEVGFEPGQRFTGGTPRSVIPGVRNVPLVNTRREEDGYGAIRALDPQTGDRKWEFKLADVTDSGILTTASDLLFTGSREGSFFALDARTGAQLWRGSVGGQVVAGPITYRVGNTQYIAIAAGNAMVVFALPE
jgi:alcohol dehydrogenase (cytochrome c)